MDIHPSIPKLCKFGTSMDNKVAFIPLILDWPVSFPLQSTTEYVSALGLNLETIVLIFSYKLGGAKMHTQRKFTERLELVRSILT